MSGANRVLVYLGPSGGIAGHGGWCGRQAGQLLELGDGREGQPPCGRRARLLRQRLDWRLELLLPQLHILRGLVQPLKLSREVGGSAQHLLLALRPFKEEMLDFIQRVRSLLLCGIHW